ncbi:MAG TPA: type VI secretion system baseplate subunit TssG [Candidatus Angelobacter sp.]|nr:type VI secretion system baseplate subunit TssG [Candidatus Angelobacter sp.]
MAAPSRQYDSAIEELLLELLKEEPHRVGFFQAVRLLRRLLPDRKPVGQFVPPSTEAVRFVANPSLIFPASEIQSMQWPENPEEPVKMMVNFMGLASPLGVLPAPYVELIIERQQKKNNGFRDFLDLFNHRMISLFYRAWEKHRFFVGYERRETDHLTPLLLSVIGLNTKALTNRQYVPDEALIYYSGILGQHPRSAQGLKQILSDYFRVLVEVEQFVGRWVKLSHHDQTCFGDSDSQKTRLGSGAVVGDEIWDQQSLVRIRLGPLTRKQYLDFLPMPASRAYPALKSLLKFYSNDEVDFEVQLILKRQETPAFHMTGQEEEDNLLLGWVTWMKNAPLGRDPGETVLQM